ncbi:Gfo/Idh/MocA family oxidoreductase [Actinoplanes sp. KI2]|uniref:Gfo/Idh/MocA family protein n=1 Tax=Actinoplanes sp. KI2 TaxID=2983315 RepID=UPI0021D585F3|nr:Gfo/Idh/MocA family oxidoreductase [Actinoplanes sp. KI2]MCU7730842.1 Gfo/Idh/MocA family oxidoreductase [Actinoplanes sp. KI2]
MSTLPRFALVGAGVIGNHHGRVLSDLADRLELVAVADNVLAKAVDLAAAYGGVAYASLGAALAAAEIDVVVVCTPTGLHGEVAIEALSAGKHVIIEKPAEVTVARTDEIIRARQKAGTLVTVISQHRFDPATERTLAAIAAGELGRVTSGIASVDWWRGQSYYDSGGWRGTWELDGGGALMNQGVHTVDLLIAALGRPVEVFAYTGTLAHERIEVEDVAAGVVRFESGALGVLHATTAAYPGLSARLQVHGDRGSAVIDNDELAFFHATPVGAAAEERLMGGTRSITAASATAARATTAGATTAGATTAGATTAGAATAGAATAGATTASATTASATTAGATTAGATTASATTASSNPGQLSDAHRRQYLNFLGALAGTEELRVDLETNRQAVAVITAAYESARLGRPVTL